MIMQSTRMSQDFASAIAALKTDVLGDFDAEMLLQDWSNSRTEEELQEACLAVLTSNCAPPRMGAAIRAVPLSDASSTGMRPLWETFLQAAPGLGQAEWDNWLSGFYYQRYKRETFECFVRMVQMAPSPRERTCIAIVLSTWSALGEHEADVLAWIDELTRKEQIPPI